MRKSTFSTHLIGLICLVFILIGCAGQQGKTTPEPVAQKPGVERIESADMEMVQKRQKLTGYGPYSTVAVQTFTVSDELNAAYPDAANQCKLELISHLRGKDSFNKVVEVGAKTVGKTVKAEGEILDMRIASKSARIWGGALAGASFMTIYLKLTDIGTGKVLDEKVITSSSNPFGAAWTFGASDQSLPADMGKILGEYVNAVLRAKK